MRSARFSPAMKSSFDKNSCYPPNFPCRSTSPQGPTNVSITGDVNPFAISDASQSTKLYPQPRNPNSTLKLHFPKFTVEDPTEWIYRAKQYFEFQGIIPAQRVQLASFHLEGIALQWHRWFSKFKGPINWTEVTTALLCRFGPTEYENPSEALTHLKHTTTTVSILSRGIRETFPTH
ncbi:hypothetical protein Acr_17g0011650 [Actinidia rufa]|uniref:Retrotransposon gag domain-containing protein n=1 Tax=Actinidia rufa TaxID=165716 RepID=A0A7J0G479_9ERIC|nr:hypothetical protein Acr_17g0011650 [Actinidia rufa]